MIVRYLQCRSCVQLELPDAWGTSDQGPVCKHCGAQGRHGEWPHAEVYQLFRFVESLDASQSEYGQISSVFLASALELMLEELVALLAYQDHLYDEAAILVDALLEAYQGRSRLLGLYKRIGYGSFSSEASNLGFNDFMREWETIAEIRNKVVHGKPEEAKAISEVLVRRAMRDAVHVFAGLHNKYNAESLTYKAAIDRRK